MDGWMDGWMTILGLVDLCVVENHTHYQMATNFMANAIN